jgi:hypothetical protein
MEILPERSETMEFFGQDQVRCKIIVDKKCLQRVKNFKYHRYENSYESSYENGKDIQQN